MEYRREPYVAERVEYINEPVRVERTEVVQAAPRVAFNHGERFEKVEYVQPREESYVKVSGGPQYSEYRESNIERRDYEEPRRMTVTRTEVVEQPR